MATVEVKIKFDDNMKCIKLKINTIENEIWNNNLDEER